MKSTIGAATLQRSRQALAALAAKRHRPTQSIPLPKPAAEKDLLQLLREAGL